MAMMWTTPALAPDLQFKRKSSVKELSLRNSVTLNHCAPHRTILSSATVSGAPRRCECTKLLTDSLLVPLLKAG